jgi:ATP-binding cassette subfamily C protein
VEEAARLAAIDFPLDKNAKELSEGQRQRVLIARALLRRPHLLVLDEVISGLDQQTAERVLASVRSRVPICVVISHRPVEAEKIVEVGGGPSPSLLNTTGPVSPARGPGAEGRRRRA